LLRINNKYIFFKIKINKKVKNEYE